MTREQKVEKFLSMVKKQEGGKLHYNKGEKDITTGYGIYRDAFPNVRIFKYIDGLAKELGIETPSSKWTRDEIEKVNNKIDSKKEDELTEEFYTENYFKKIDIFELPVEMTLAVGSMLVNSQKLGSKALQMSYNLLLKKFSKRYPKEFAGIKEISEDGIIGPATAKAVYTLVKAVEGLGGTATDLWFSIYMSCAKSLYVEMSTDNGKEDKQLSFLRGWVLNRCDYLIKNIDDLV